MRDADELAELDYDSPDLQPPAPATPLDIDSLLDNPLTAALVSAQLSKGPPKPRKAPSASTSQPISKPKTQQLRPKHQLDRLQKHLDSVANQVKLLSIRNHQLHTRKQALETLVEGINLCETFAQQGKLDVAHHKAHPTEALCGAALYHTWTPQQYITFYKNESTVALQWMLEVDAAVAAGWPPPADALGQLAASHTHVLEVTFHVCQAEPAFILRVAYEMLKVFPPGMDEEAHWAQVVQAMELSRAQVEEILMARDVFLGIVGRLENSLEAFQAALSKGSLQAAQAASLDSGGSMEEELVAQIEANMRKNTNMALLMAMAIFRRTLTPLQLAKCALHANPLFPYPIIILNAIHAKYGQAPGTPQLGPRDLPGLASARTLQASLQLHSSFTANLGLGLPPATPARTGTATLPTSLSGNSSSGNSSSGSANPGSVSRAGADHGWPDPAAAPQAGRLTCNTQPIAPFAAAPAASGGSWPVLAHWHTNE